MNIARFILAVGWAIAGIGITTAATAQPYRGYGYHHRDCHVEYHHHHRVRVCR